MQQPLPCSLCLAHLVYRRSVSKFQFSAPPEQLIQKTPTLESCSNLSITLRSLKLSWSSGFPAQTFLSFSFSITPLMQKMTFQLLFP